MKAYGAAETIDRAATPLPDAITGAHPDGIDVLIDLASDARQFAAVARHVRPGGTAITTRYVADREALAVVGVAGVNFQLRLTVSLLDRLATAVVAGIIVPPPITRTSLERGPCAAEQARPRRRKNRNHHLSLASQPQFLKSQPGH